MARVRVEFRLQDQGRRKKVFFTLSVTLSAIAFVAFPLLTMPIAAIVLALQHCKFPIFWIFLACLKL